MIMSSKKWLLGACGLVLATASAAQASMMIDVRLASVWKSPTGATAADRLSVPADKKTYTLDAQNPAAPLGQLTFQFDIYAVVRGTDTDPKNDGVQSVIGNIVSNGPAGITGFPVPFGSDSKSTPVVRLVGVAPFNGGGAQNGPATSSPPFMGSALPNDGVGTGDFVAIRADGMTTYPFLNDPDGFPTVPNPAWLGDGSPNAGIQAKLGSFRFTPTPGNIVNGVLEFNWAKRLLNTAGNPVADSAATWAEDGAGNQLNANTGQLSIGTPAAVTFINVPEPASLSLLGFGALGLLARRRTR